MPKSKKEKQLEGKRKAYAWVSYMLTHEPDEMARVRKYGTPSDWLIEDAKNSKFFTNAEGFKRKISFPYSLNTSKGQKALYDILLRVDKHLKAIPIKAHELLQHVKATVRHRRSDTQRNLHMVAEAILHRAACEFKTEVLFAFDSMNVWIKSVYGKELGYHTLHKALETLVEAKVIKVNEWGKRGVRTKATKIEILPVTRKTILTYTSEIDDWLLLNDHAMNAVYARESATRQNVLEQAIHAYANALIKQEQTAAWATDFLIAGGGLVKSKDARMVEVEVTTTEKVNDNDYFVRLLGELVQPVQAHDSVDREAGSRIRRTVGAGQGERGSP